MAFDITFDYRFDTTGFFDDPDRRATLEAAATIWEGLIGDEFADIPAGTSFTIDDPSNSGSRVQVVLDEAIDDLLIFVGAESLSSSLALGGYDGVDAAGDIHRSRIDGNFRTGPVTDFEPWVGTMTFNTNANLSFTLDAPVAGASDVIGVVLHEIAHILGIGTSPTFRTIGAGGSFDGVNALALNNGQAIPLQSGLGHVAEGFGNDTVLMDPTQTVGTRSQPGVFDLALLADIGYEIEGYDTQGAPLPLATEGDDLVIRGTELADTLDGLGGDDRIDGDAGADTLLGGTGEDTLFGSEGDDDLSGGADDDQLQGGDDNDTLLGDAGGDLLFGQNGNDDLDGGAGDDGLQGGSGDDTLRGGEGEDGLRGGIGTDSFVVTAGGGTVTINDMDLDTEVITIDGSGFADAAAAAAAVTKEFSNVSRLTFADGTAIRVFHDSQTGSPLTAAHFILPDAAPVITDTTGTGTVTGGATSETLQGLDGDDDLDGGAGDDTLDGGADTDTYVASGPGAVTVDLGAGTATDGFGGSDTLISIEGARGGAQGDSLTGSDDANALSGEGGDDSIDGGDGNDDITGDDGDDTVTAGAGNDTVDGGAGADTITGDDGDDVLSGDAGRDTLEGGAGNDTLSGGADGDTVSGGAGNDDITGGTGDDDLSGGSGNDTVSGGDGNDTLDGGSGADRMDGGAGDDTYRIDNSRDRITEAADGGRDVVRATAEVTLGSAEVEEVILEGTRGIRVNGNGGDTTITGNSGSNILVGGGGDDTLFGGGGDDFFAFQITDPTGPAVILDFTRGEDKLALDDRYFDLGTGRIEPRDVTDAQATSALNSGAVRYDGRTGEVFIDVDGRRGPEAEQLVVILEGGGPLSADDVLLF